MISIPTSLVRKEFSDTLNRVIYLRERVILERRGKRVAAIIPIGDYDNFMEYLDKRQGPKRKK